MKRIANLVLLAAMAAATPLWAAEVNDVKARQRWPWNGLVDIDCTVSGINGTDYGLDFAVAAVMPDSSVHNATNFWVAKDGKKSFVWCVPTNGNYRLIWDARADLGPELYSNVVVRVTVVSGHARAQLWEGGPYWAMTNVGAEKPEGYGLYFWWGDTVGYKYGYGKWVASDGSSSDFKFSDQNSAIYTYGRDIATLQSGNENEKWITADGVLAPAHDAAHVKWGGGWRMPTQQDLDDLLGKCDWVWTTQNGVKGWTVTGRGDYASASIFLPCAGYGDRTSLYGVGSYGTYWSSVPNSGSDYYSWGLDFFSSDHGTDNGYRYFGHSVRPVQGFTEALMAAAGVAHAGDSAEMVLDLRTGPRASGGDETLAFSSLWDGGADATVTIAQDGVAIAGNLAGEGERAWSVPYNGTYELTHVTYTNGVAGKVETATFVVTGKAEPPEVTDVVATPSEPWDGRVSISFNVVNSPAAACPDWNRPYLSIVATDNVTGSNYVSVASALSDNTDTADGPHTVTWDFDAQGIDFFSTNVTFTVAYLRMPDWCVIDLSGGKDASHYPVTYVSNVPRVSNVPDVPGVTFNADAYKTTNLVMRLVGPEADGEQPFYCAVFETTQRQWELVTGARPSYFTNETCYATRPVEKVSWNMIRGDANTYDWPNVQGVASDSFVGVLRQKTDLNALDLPTEAQWEYACRAGTTSQYNNGGDTEDDLQALGRYRNNGGSGSSDSCATDHGTAAVGSYLPNAWGLYDMHGNVWEWCLERYSSSGSYRVGRGGCWFNSASYCTSSFRNGGIPSNVSNYYGFRLVRTLSNNFESERSAEAAAGAERAGTVCAGVSAPVEVGAPPPEVTDVVATPTGGAWQGQVDISFNVTNDVARGLPDWNAPVLSIVATDNLTGSNYVSAATALTGQTDAAEGVHEVIWNLDAQGIELDSTNVTFTVAYLRMPDHCVIDLSGGTNATSYAVSYLDAEPAGGFTNDLYRTGKLAMRLVAPGTFTMGVDGSGVGVGNPPHAVTLTNAYYIAVFETTQRQWELVTGGKPSRYRGDTRPVEKVSYDMIRGSSLGSQWPEANSVDDDSFLGVLRRKTGLSALDLPTEAQWEYACRAGSTNRYNGVDTQDLNRLGRYCDNRTDGRGGCSEHTVVGSYAPNSWGLYDMHGNVWEWCLDWYGALSRDEIEPVGAPSSSGSGRVERGGSWNGYASHCTSSSRYGGSTSDGNGNSGFRLVRTLSNDLEGERSGEAAVGAERAGTVCSGAAEPISLIRRASVAFSGKFTLTGRAMAAGEFTAGLYDAGGNQLQTVVNAADGTFAFDAIEYGLADAGKTFSYVVRQEAGTDAGIQYDTAEYTVTVAVSVGADRLVVNVTDNFTALDFANVCPPPEITDVVAESGAPWDGTVTISFNVTNSPAAVCPGWNAPFLSIVATDNLTGSNYVSDAAMLTGGTDANPGPHTVTWRLGEQGIDFSSTNVTFTVAYLRMPDYCVIDLSGGSNAAHYAVSYLDAEPENGFTNDLYRTTKLAMRLLAPGSFQMGVDGSNPDYNPPHSVTLTQPFYCAVFETTQKQWELVQGPHESGFAGDTRPVETVSYNDIRGSANVAEWPATNEVEATFFLGKLRSKTGIASLDLPTEAQWEYACRAGTETKYCCADSEIGNYAWYSTSATHEVGAKRPNAWGLYDMHGNVREWCLDWSDFSSLSTFAVTNPLSSSGSYRVRRGGSWNDFAPLFCSSSVRLYYGPSDVHNYGGFRLVRTLSDNLEGERSPEAAAGAERAGTVCAGTSASIAVGMKEFADTDIRLTPYDAPYDGQPHTIGVQTNEAIAGLVLKYAVGRDASTTRPDGRFVETSLPEYVNVTNVRVWVEASAPGYYTFTTNATLTITQRAVTLTSGSASKVYDGTPVTCADVLVGADGFAPGEGATFDVTGSQTHVGSGENAFTYSLNAGTLAGNYEIATSNGTLTITKAANAWIAAPTMAGWTVGAAPASPNKGKAKFGTATVAYGKAGGAAGGLGATRPSAAGSYTATFTVPGTANYTGLTKTVAFTIKPKPTYTVTFDANGGKGGATARKTAGAALKAPAVTRAGYRLKGWSPAVPAAMPAANVTYKAVWTPLTYKVKFSANGGTLEKGKSMAAQTFTPGKAAALRGNAFVRDGYVFIGWSKRKNGPVAYKNGQKVKNLAKAGKSVTLYAAWAKAEYKVVFDASGGRGKMPRQTFTYGEEQNLVRNRFKRKGYVFGGWAIRDPLATIPKVAYKDGQAVKNLSADGRTVRLYAVWKRR